MHLPEFGVKRPITSLMIFSAALLLGIVSLLFLSIDLMPEIDPPSISVITGWPGTAAEDVETKVTKVIENDLSIVTNLDEIKSVSKENVSIVTCKFSWSTNLDEASNEIRDNLEFSKRVLPDDVEEPIVFKFNTSLFPILYLGVCAEENWEKLEDLIDDQLASPLKRLPGVGTVAIMGGKRRQINVHIDLARLQAYGLSWEQVVRSLAAENLTLPAGSLKMGRTEYVLRVPGEYQHVKEIPNIIVKRDGVSLVYLRDIAVVEDGFREQQRMVNINGRPGLFVVVQKRSGANTVEVINRCHQELARIQKTLPQDVDICVLFDSSQFIKTALQNLSRTVLWGGLLVCLVTLFFLRQLRATLIVLITIPFSLVVSFIFLYIFNFTINIMSLASIALATGMVVDNAVVILENILSHHEQGERIAEASIFGASEVGLAVLASTMTTVVIFVPMIFVGGITGIIFRQLAIVVTVTLITSLLVSLTLTPMLTSRILSQAATSERRHHFFFQVSENLFRRVESGYGIILLWALAHKKTIIHWTLCAFAASLFLIPFIGSDFIPEEDTGDLKLVFELPVGTKVELTAAKALKISELFRQMFSEQIRHVFFSAGQSEESFGSSLGMKEGPNVGVVQVKLVPQQQRALSSKEIGRQMIARLQQDTDIVKFSMDAGNPINAVLLGGGKPISIEISGHDLEETDSLARRLEKIVKNTPGAIDASISRDAGKPEIKIIIDRPRSAALGLETARVIQSLRTFFYGRKATKFREGDNEYDIFVRLQESQRRNIADIANASIDIGYGHKLRVDTIASVVQSLGPIEIERKNQERLVKVEADTFRRSLGEVTADIERNLAHIDLPAGVTIHFGGMVKEQRESFRDLTGLLALGIMLVYMVMASQFESLRYPFVIMFSVPFAFVGVILILFLTRTTLSLLSFVGLIMLMGIVVNNAIILVDYINILRARGQELTAAIATAGSQRLRPVLITTCTTICGMLPLALISGEGSEIWKPLGITVIGGLAMSSLVTLVLVPVIYALFTGHREAKHS